MCTTGAKILNPGREFVLFKNRDFTRDHFDDRITLTDQSFGVLGLETWDGSDPASDRFSGYSIGFNAHLACCDSNVRGLPEGESYDKLVQAVVEHCTTVDEAIEQVRTLVSERLFSWGNLLVVTPDGIAALEVRDHHVEVVRDPAMLVRANHHVKLGTTPSDDDITTSVGRYNAASQGLRAATHLDAVFPFLRAHKPDREHSVCNHGLYTTVYSYVVHWRDGAITFYVHQGHPCDGEPYVRLPIGLGGEVDLAAYPSTQVR